MFRDGNLKFIKNKHGEQISTEICVCDLTIYTPLTLYPFNCYHYVFQCPEKKDIS